MGYVHTPPRPRAVQTFDAADEVRGFEAELEERTAGEAKYIRKLYSVQAGELPRPKAACYGVTTDPQEVQAVIDAAAVLLDGQETFWNADIDFMPNSEMRYYRDESILVVAWQEAIEGRGCSFVEVKLADGSQLRRKISGDSYRAAGLKTATELAAEDNAVMAVSGDFTSAAKHPGSACTAAICNTSLRSPCIPACSPPAGTCCSCAPETSDMEDAEKFISDNDVEFSVNFGPILVENRGASGPELRLCLRRGGQQIFPAPSVRRGSQNRLLLRHLPDTEARHEIRTCRWHSVGVNGTDDRGSREKAPEKGSPQIQ